MQLLRYEIVLGARQSYMIGSTEKNINYIMHFDLIWLL
jgi:UDP-glucose 4-epimerase